NRSRQWSFRSCRPLPQARKRAGSKPGRVMRKPRCVIPIPRSGRGIGSAAFEASVLPFLNVAEQIPRLTAARRTRWTRFGRRRLGTTLLLGSSFVVLLTGCTRTAAPARSFVEEPFPEKLSAWHLFTARDGALRPNQGVLPYDLNTPLFSDYAAKYRFVWMP